MFDFPEFNNETLEYRMNGYDTFPEEWAKEKVATIDPRGRLFFESTKYWDQPDAAREKPVVTELMSGKKTRFTNGIKPKPGDTIWSFSSSEASWNSLSGRGGFVVFRDGKVYAIHTTMLS